MGTMEIIIVNPGAAVRIKLDNAENGTIQEESTLLVPSVNSPHRPVTPFTVPGPSSGQNGRAGGTLLLTGSPSLLALRGQNPVLLFLLLSLLLGRSL